VGWGWVGWGGVGWGGVECGGMGWGGVGLGEGVAPQPPDWAPVSEPGFLDFQVSSFLIIKPFCGTKYFRKIRWCNIKEYIIKVSWRDPGQNGWF